MNRSRGFTLAELMVVIGIIALLVMIIMPTLSSAGAEARRILCLNNLNKINQATHTWATGSRSWDQHALAEGGWTTVVESRTDSHEVLRCPEGGPLANGKSADDQMVIRPRPDLNVSVSLVPVYNVAGQAYYYSLLKFSQTQAAKLVENVDISPEPYVPDANPNIYYWCYEDLFATGDVGDYQDVLIRVENLGSGKAKVFVESHTGQKPMVWSPDLKNCLARDPDIRARGDGGNGGVEFTLNVGGGTHYGMNTARIDMRQLDKIQVLDYLNATANSTDDWAREDWDENKDGQPDFLRHKGRLNAATLGGSAKTYPRWQLDPADIEVERQLWQK